MRSTVGSIALSAALVTGCSSPELATDPVVQPAGWDADLSLREAIDEDPDARVVEVRLEAKVAPIEIIPGKPTQMWTYDGGLPGPLIRAKVGDRLVVHFVNRLPVPTTIHWHGLRIPAAMDGVPGHSQPEIPPEGTFDYEFELPDAGLFWYHPHVRSAEQVGSGLYGPILVEAPDEPDLGDELILVLGDVSLEEDGALQASDVGGDLGTLFGREGTHILVNGRRLPTLRPRAGLPQRWRIVNTARSRYFQLELPGHGFTRVGGDGGLSTEPEALERLVLVPGQRADAVIAPTGSPGSAAAVRWVPYDRGYGSTEFRDVEDIMRILFSDDLAVDPPPVPHVGRTIERIDVAGATPVALSLTQAVVDGKLELGINGVPSWEAEPLEAQVDETQVWTIDNEMEWAHPFHLHGFFFQALDETGAPVLPLEWRDSVDVPEKGRAAFAVRYDDRAGMWMFHCHILDHADAGMMGMLHLAHH